MRKNDLLKERNFLTPKELSEVFDHNISVTTINVLIREGKIPSTKLGRKNLIPVSFVREQLDKRLPSE